MPRTLREILEQAARRHPNRPCFRTAIQTSCYRDALNESHRLARFISNELQASSAVPIGVSASDPARLLHVVWACIIADVSLAFLPACRNPDEMQRMMHEAGARILLTDIAELSNLPWAANFEALDMRLQAREPIETAAAPTKETAQRGAFLLQTSGTAGEPRWVACSFQQHLRVLECMHSAGCLEHAAGRTVFLTVPLFHSYGLCTLLEYLTAGGTLVFPSGESRFGPIGDLNAAHIRESVDAIEAVPYFYEQLAKLGGRLRPPRIVHVGFGGGAVSATVSEVLHEYWPQARYSVRYGLTETPSVVSHKVGTLAQRRDPRDAGSILSCYDVRIVDARGRSVERGREGEITLYGDNLGSYLGEDPPEGFPTGDLGYLEHGGALFVSGRKSSFLKNRGFRVSPERIEALLMTMDGIRDGRVLMRDNRLLAELVADDDSTPTRHKVIDFLAERLPAYWVPDKISFVPQIPRTATGKIRRV